MSTKRSWRRRVPELARGLGRRLAADPDSPLAVYRCLWTSLGRRSGVRVVPRPVHFLYLVSIDSVSFVGWYLLRRIGRAGAGGRVNKLRRTAAGFGWAFVLPMAFAFLVDGILIYGFVRRGWVPPPWFETIVSPVPPSQW